MLKPNQCTIVVPPPQAEEDLGTLVNDIVVAGISRSR